MSLTQCLHDEEFRDRHLFRVARRKRSQSPHECAGCRSRRARFRYRGEVRADHDHNLCFKCFRSLVDRLRARRLSIAAQPLRMTLTAHAHVKPVPAAPKRGEYLTREAGTRARCSRAAGLPSGLSSFMETSCALAIRDQTDKRPDRIPAQEIC